MNPRQGWIPIQDVQSGSCWSSTRRAAPSSSPPTSWMRLTSLGTGLLSSIVASQYLQKIFYIFTHLRSILAGSFVVAPHSILSPDMVLDTTWHLWSNSHNHIKLSNNKMRLRRVILMGFLQLDLRRKWAQPALLTALMRQTMKESQIFQLMKPLSILLILTKSKSL